MDLPRGYRVRGNRTFITLDVTIPETEIDGDGRAIYRAIGRNGGDRVLFESGWPGLLTQIQEGDRITVLVERIGGERRATNFTQPTQRERQSRD